MVIEHDDVFYLGDQPVVLQRTFDLKNGTNLDFDVQGVEAFMPLYSTCAHGGLIVVELDKAQEKDSEIMPWCPWPDSNQHDVSTT